MTPEQQNTVRVLAERMGFKPRSGWKPGSSNPQGYWRGLSALLRYLSSRDELAPVLATLTPEENDRLAEDLTEMFLRLEASSHGRSIAFSTWLLTLPPETLAHAIARAIEKK